MRRVLGVHSPFFSAIVLLKSQPFVQGFRWFSRRNFGSLEEWKWKLPLEGWRILNGLRDQRGILEAVLPPLARETGTAVFRGLFPKPGASSRVIPS